MENKTLLTKIDELKEKLPKGPLDPALQKNLDAWYAVELTYTSNAIEGNTLTRQETALVIEKGITPEGKTLTESLEAQNHAKAFAYVKECVAKYTGITEITLCVLLDIHRLILEKIDDVNAGRLRTVPVRVAGSATIFPNPTKVPELMEEFAQWLHAASDHSASIAVEAHYRLVTIHPFADGNGRTARLLLNMILLQDGYPPIIVDNLKRHDYITSLERAQTTADKDEYERFMYERIIASLETYLAALK